MPSLRPHPAGATGRRVRAGLRGVSAIVATDRPESAGGAAKMATRRRLFHAAGTVGLAGLLLAAIAGCGPAAERPTRPNVILVVVDTLGAEHLGSYRRGLQTSPTIDRLASQGVRFENAYSPAPWTQPAMASLLTSKMPSRHGLWRLFQRLDDRWETLPQFLNGRGYASAAVVSHFLLSPTYGFDRGFDSFDTSAIGPPNAVTGPSATDAAIGWLARRPTSQPFFLLVHYFDVHYPYLDHPEHDFTSGYQGALRPGLDLWELRDSRSSLSSEDVRYLVGLYHEEVAATDAEIGRLVDGLADLRLADETLVIITADHGEEIMDHGWIGHTRNLYADLIRVPLVFYWPGRLSPRVVEAPVSLLDIAPTLLDLAGSGSSHDLDGSTLVPLLQGKNPPGALSRQLFAEVAFQPGAGEPARLNQKTAYKTALIEGRVDLVHDLLTNSWELYDRSTDPAQMNDRFASWPRAERDRLVRRLAAWERERPRPDPGDGSPGPVPGAADLERLRALGYLR